MKATIAEDSIVHPSVEDLTCTREKIVIPNYCCQVYCEKKGQVDKKSGTRPPISGHSSTVTPMKTESGYNGILF